MTKLLRIDSSARVQHSHSRELADIFEKEWRVVNPLGTVIVRDIIASPIPHISQNTITGFYTPPEQLDEALTAALTLSNQLVAELKEAEGVLISAPIYNFSVPSSLKAWIDHIVRSNHTFAFDGKAFTGLLTGKKAYLCLAYGGEGYAEGPMKAVDFVNPYLQALFGFLGFDSVEAFVLEGTNSHPEALPDRIQQNHDRMKHVLGN